MYYPILRGKLNELLALRELAQLELKNYVPVIEPVKKDIKALVKTIESLNSKAIEPYIIINPTVGDFSSHPLELSQSLTLFKELRYKTLYAIDERTKQYENFLALNEFGLFIQKGIDTQLIHFSESSKINFIQNDVSPNVKRLIKNKVIYEDFFRKQKKNADYPEESPFSSLHSYYQDDRTNIGFSDYTITGDDFIEGGGPAYVVTIHCSYIDTKRFDELFIRHFSSKDDGTPTNPGAKFLEALNLLIKEIDEKHIPFTHTDALKEFKYLHKIEHFPGLGQVKKISIKHHIETVNNFLSVPAEINR